MLKTIKFGSKRFRNAVIIGAALFVCIAMAADPIFAQSVGSLDQMQQIKNALQSSSSSSGLSADSNSDQSTDQSNGGRSPNIVLQPAYAGKEPNSQPPPSRLEQIMSSKAGFALRQFGYQDLDTGSSVIVPQVGAVQDDYILGPGDELVVSLRGQENSEYREKIDRNGQVTLPRIDPITAAGHTLGEFRQSVASEIRRAYISTQAFVSVGDLRQISVAVTGEVNAPGVRIVTGLSSPLDAILLSGGVKKTGSLRNVKLIHGGIKTTIDLYSILTQRGIASQIKLTDGDRVVVPPLGPTVAAAGWLRRSGIYELSPGTDHISVRQLITLAGGLELRGQYRLSALRIEQDGSNLLVSLPSESGIVHDGEILFVQPKADQINQSATLSGGTSLAGRYSVHGAASLYEVLKEPGALGKDPDSLFGLIVRRDILTKVASLVPFSPAAVLERQENIPLNSEDLVRVFTTREASLLSADIAEFRRQLAISDEKHRAPLQTARAQSGGQDNGTDDNITGLDQNGPSERQIVAYFSPKTLGEGGVLSDRLPTNEYPPYGLTKNQTHYLANAIPPVGLGSATGSNSTNGTDSLNGSNYKQGSSQSSVSGNGSLSTYLADQKRLDQTSSTQNIPAQPSGNFSLSDIQPSAALPLFSRPSQEAANLEQQAVSGNEFQSNLEVETFGQLARQLRVDPLVLAHFINDNCVTVNGSAFGAGYYLVGPNTTIHDFVAAIGGLSNQTDVNHVELISNDAAAGSSQVNILRRIVSLTDAATESYELHPRDELRFNPIDNPLDAGTVTLQGQVRYPGTYHVERGERLSELLLRAGGLTDVAYPYGTVFLRRSIAEAEHEGNIRSANEIQSIIASDLSRIGQDKLSPDAFSALNSFAEQLRDAPALGRMSVVSDPVILTADPSRDPMLEAGDLVFIPQRPSTVTVLGQVNQPGTFIYSSSATVDDYVARAGGYSALSDESETFIVLPDGTARKSDTSWLSFGSASLPPGTTIVVQRDVAPIDTRQLILDFAGLLQSFALTAASLAVIRNN